MEAFIRILHPDYDVNTRLYDHSLSSLKTNDLGEVKQLIIGGPDHWLALQAGSYEELVSTLLSWAQRIVNRDLHE